MINEKMNSYHAEKQAEGMRKKVESGEASDYNEAEKIQEKEELIENLTKAHDCIKEADSSYIVGLRNCLLYLKNAGQKELAQIIETELVPKSCIINIKKSLELLENFNGQNEEIFNEAMNNIGHNVLQIAKFGDANSYSTEFDKIILKFIADISFAQEDHMYIMLYDKIGEVEKYEEVRKIAEKTKSCRAAMSPDEWNEYKERNKSPERVSLYKKLMQNFIEDTRDLKENDINFENVLMEVKQKIENKLKQVK